MTILFIDSFDHYIDLSQKYTGSRYATISSGSGRYGTAGVHIGYGSGSSPGYFYKTFSSSEYIFTAGFAWTRTVDRGPMVSPCQIVEFYYSGGVSESVSVSLGREGELYIGTGSNSATTLGISTRKTVPNKSYYLEFSVLCDQSVGQATIRLNGTKWIDLSDVNTSPYTYYGNIFDTVKIHAGGEPNIDDLYISNDIEPLGDVRIFTLYPSLDGATSQWTPSSGSAHYSLVNESPPVTTGYVSSSGSLTDLYEFDTFEYGIGTAQAVQLNHLLASGTATTGTLDIYGKLTSGSLSYTTSASGLAGSQTTYQYKSFIIDDDPITGKEWLLEDINTYQFGIA